MVINQVDVQSPLELARQFAPLIRSSADQIEAGRELPRPLFEALADAGLFRLVMPRSLGGRELDLPTYVRTLEELGKADASTAWSINQGGVFATYSACLPLEVARKIWVDTPRSVVANSPSPVGTAVPVDGGYRVSGRFGFSTGSRHASWLAAHAWILDDGQPRLQPDGQPARFYLLVPVAEVELLDTWRTRGMRGTGTHHFAVDDVFVPQERTFPSTAIPVREPGPLYKFARTLLYGSGDAAVALGVARSSLDAFVELAGGKRPFRAPGLLSELPMVQADFGRAEATLRSARAMLFEAVREAWEGACANGALTIEQRAGVRLAITHAVRLAAQVVDTLYNHAGATAVFENHPLQRYFQDIHVITQHIQARLLHYELIGRHLLGLEIELDRL